MKKNISNKTSIFDPVLAEIILRWFAPLDGGLVVDPFAGDSSFGFISSVLGFRFTGIELRQEQVDVNSRICEGIDGVRYVCDDGRNIVQHVGRGEADLLFSCPPYFNLEKYSDDERDASNQKDYSAFLSVLSDVLTAGGQCLKENRFAVIVIGDVRDNRGGYYDIPGDTVKIFQKNGFSLVNHFILVESMASAALRAARQMSTARKAIKVHQDVLVFYKGNPRDVKNHFGVIEIEENNSDGANVSV